LLIPHVVAAPLVGVLVDRARQPRWVLASAMLIFAGGLFCAAALLGHAPLGLVYVLLLVGGCWIFVGPFGTALFLSRTQYADPAVRAQVFTIGAGLKVTASALGAALIGFAAGLPVATQLLLVANSPLLAGVLGSVLLTFGTRPEKLHHQRVCYTYGRSIN
jgi:MFS family permease